MSKSNPTVTAVLADGTEVEYPIAAMIAGTPEHAAAAEAHLDRYPEVTA